MKDVSLRSQTHYYFGDVIGLESGASSAVSKWPPSQKSLRNIWDTEYFLSLLLPKLFQNSPVFSTKHSVPSLLSKSTSSSDTMSHSLFEMCGPYHKDHRYSFCKSKHSRFPPFPALLHCWITRTQEYFLKLTLAEVANNTRGYRLNINVHLQLVTLHQQQIP